MGGLKRRITRDRELKEGEEAQPSAAATESNSPSSHFDDAVHALVPSSLPNMFKGGVTAPSSS